MLGHTNAWLDLLRRSVTICLYKEYHTKYNHNQFYQLEKGSNIDAIIVFIDLDDWSLLPPPINPALAHPANSLELCFIFIPGYRLPRKLIHLLGCLGCPDSSWLL
jgi:hypothetical protein